MAKLSPVILSAQLINGIPANGAKLFAYAAGSSTKQNTYTDITGVTPQSNPIILDSRGEPASPIWLTEGLSYKFVFTASTDSDPPVAPIWDIDNVTGINDATITLDQWVSSGVTPTYVSATQFTLPGDQTSAFQVNRRIKATVTAGTVYGYISASVFGALTTVTVVLDSGVLDSGLSAVSLGLITPTNTSLPILKDTDFKISGSADVTKILRVEVDGITTATTRVWTAQDKNITVAGLDDINGGSQLGSKIQPITASVAASALTITLNPTTLDFRSATIGSGTVNTRSVSAAISVVVSSGSTLGTTNAVENRLTVIAIDNSGTVELAVLNNTAGLNMDETGLISTTAEGGAGAADSANVIYSTTARSNVAYRVVGYIVSTQATAGTWATAPSKIQGDGGLANISTALNAQGTAPMYACRAWVNFNGTGTVAIRGSGNVTSITDNGVGDYTVNFTTAMPDANYCFEFSGIQNSSAFGAFAVTGGVAAGSLRLFTFRVDTRAAEDTATVCVSIFR